VELQTLGRFRVLRDGEPVPRGAWQSRKARDLLKVLAARRGRPVPRDALMELLWPDEDPRRAGSRLSVLLSTVRAVLDPEKRHAPDHFVAADGSAYRLQLEHVVLDVQAFLDAAEAALAAARAGAADAPERLLASEAVYAGDFLEEDVYEDWAVALREEGRAVYIEVVRALAGRALEDGRTDDAGRFFLRLLERDPYDERAHLGLVAALVSGGRHGEARR
jgi:DNA-binding SARP family transcriptional activator